VDGEDIDQAGQGEDAAHLPAWRGQQQVTAGLPGLRPAQRAQGAAVDELKRGQIDDNPRVTSRSRREYSHDARGIYDVKFAASPPFWLLTMALPNSNAAWTSCSPG
jgi:hypothetical protein